MNSCANQTIRRNDKNRANRQFQFLLLISTSPASNFSILINNIHSLFSVPPSLQCSTCQPNEFKTNFNSRNCGFLHDKSEYIANSNLNSSTHSYRPVQKMLAIPPHNSCTEPTTTTETHNKKKTMTETGVVVGILIFIVYYYQIHGDQ